VRASKDWIDELAKAERIAISEGHFRADLDPEQFAFEEYGIMLGTHTFGRFLRERDTMDRSKKAFERLMNSSLAPGYRPA